MEFGERNARVMVTPSLEIMAFGVRISRSQCPAALSDNQPQIISEYRNNCYQEKALINLQQLAIM
jgi:hypothetical protein